MLDKYNEHLLLIGRNYAFIFCAALLSLTSCQEKNRAYEIIENSLQAHGGVEKWQQATELSYKKTTILYDSVGNIEKKIIQKHTNTFQPVFSAEMQWIEDSISKKVIFKDNQISVLYDNVLQNNSNQKQQYRKNIIAANYVIWQPYKLLDTDVTLDYLGEENIDDKTAHVIQASYYNDDDSPANTWWYYFDVETYLLLGNMVHHGTTYSYIKNIKYENQTGLSLNAERKSYMTDSLRNIKFLRANYFYEIFDLK
ncbi:DUF6503 family protein [Aquimarina sp. 2201CG5-10]|uniref:DUF6503 family protein n=1 Tax=Aquimarina callyspongiae TaxID=3098150 RepID=UPI002AB3D448|nr:DUF6503 family protein [Aquimarina sp. 2201CG5-10]MDY8137079.1 DUF6503 family protein [Aquimarina sp. 2201CG5-10]